jgi:hypothetical protein
VEVQAYPAILGEVVLLARKVWMAAGEKTNVLPSTMTAAGLVEVEVLVVQEGEATVGQPMAELRVVQVHCPRSIPPFRHAPRM